MPNIGPLVIFYVHPVSGIEQYNSFGSISWTLEALVARIVPDGVEHTVIYEPRPNNKHIWREGAWVLDPVIARNSARFDLVGRIRQLIAPYATTNAPEEIAPLVLEIVGADVVLAGGNSPLISAKATALGVTVTVAATAIATANAQYLRVAGALSGELQLAEELLALANTQTEIDTALADSIAKMETEIEAITT